MATIRILMTDTATPLFQSLVKSMRQRRVLHRMVGLRFQDLTRKHLLQVAGSRHATARRLGAAPSGHWGKAAEKVSKPGALKTNDTGGELSIKQPGITRAVRDVTIKPTGGREFLALPMIAQAYNKMARRIRGLFRPLKAGAKATGSKTGKDGRKVPVFDSDDRYRVLAKRNGDQIDFYYALVKEVHQRRDPTLLPSEEEYQQAAIQGGLDFVQRIKAERGRA